MSRIYKMMPNCAATDADYSNHLNSTVNFKSTIGTGSKLLRLSSLFIMVGLTFSYQAFAVVSHVTSSQDSVVVNNNCLSEVSNTSACAALTDIGYDSKVTQARTIIDTDPSNKVIALDKRLSMRVNDINDSNKVMTDNYDGVVSTDTASGGQLNTLRNNLGSTINKLGYKIDNAEDNANAGISAAMAMSSIPQAFLPGRSLLGGGITTYNGENAVAIGLSTVSNSGQWVIKVNGTADSQGNAGGAIGAGFHLC